MTPQAEAGGTCRLCLGLGARCCLFAASYCDMLLSLAQVTAYENDGLPTRVCEKCISNLKSAYSFKKQCEESHSILIQNLGKEDKLEIKEEVVCSPYVDLDLDEISTKTETCLIKSEFCDTSNLIDKCDSYNRSDDYDDIENVRIKSKVKHFKKHKKKLKQSKIEKPKNKSSLRDSKTKEILGVDVNTLKNSDGLFKCDQCSRTFQCKRGFVRHLERHMGIKSFFCEICQKYYAREWVHMQTHIRPRVKEFLCEHCNKMFESKGALNYHIKVHTDDKPHICDDCGKAFKRLDRLEIHKKIHSGIKEYICQFCSKDFYMQKNLLTHIKYKHTEERSFQCDRCEKRFVTRQCLKIHERRHLGIKNFRCEFCEKAFVSKSGLIAHLTMHTKEKPHACRVCAAKFGRTDHRNRHELKAHGVDFRQNA